MVVRVCRSNDSVYLFIAVTVTCLIMQQRYGKRYHDYQSVLTEDDSGASESTVSVRDIEDHGNVIHRRGRRLTFICSSAFHGSHFLINYT